MRNHLAQVSAQLDVPLDHLLWLRRTLDAVQPDEDQQLVRRFATCRALALRIGIDRR